VAIALLDVLMIALKKERCPNAKRMRSSHSLKKRAKIVLSLKIENWSPLK